MSELSTSSANEGELNFETRPFIIRGHHLGHFAFLQRSSLEPVGMADKIVNSYENNSFTRPTDTAIDVIGKTVEEKALYKSRLTRVFAQFASLAPGDTVRIVSGQPDEICGACITGSHCHTRGLDYRIRTGKDEYGYANLNQLRDMYDIKKYRQIASTLGLSALVTKDDDMAIDDTPKHWFVITVDEGEKLFERHEVTYQPPITDTARNVSKILSSWSLA